LDLDVTIDIKKSYKLTDDILTVLNNKLLIGVIIGGLEKAFWLVGHASLLSKLEFHEFGSKVND